MESLTYFRANVFEKIIYITFIINRNILSNIEVVKTNVEKTYLHFYIRYVKILSIQNSYLHVRYLSLRSNKSILFKKLLLNLYTMKEISSLLVYLS